MVSSVAIYRRILNFIQTGVYEVIECLRADQIDSSVVQMSRNGLMSMLSSPKFSVISPKRKTGSSRHIIRDGESKKGPHYIM